MDKLSRVRDWLSARLAAPAEPAAGEAQSAPPRPRRLRLVLICAAIFLIACGTRLMYWQDSRADLLRTGHGFLTLMTAFYFGQARAVLEHGGLLFPERPPDPADATLLAHPPGYSILVVTLYRLLGGEGDDLTRTEPALRALQTVADACAALVVVLIAAELFPLGVAVIAGLLVSLSPHLAYYALFLSPDTLAVLPILLAVYFIIRAIKRPRLIHVAAAGLMIGLSCWLRSNALLLAPFMALAVAWQFERGKRLRYGLAMIAAMVMTILPVTVRNALVFHRFIPLSLGAGVTLIEGIAEYDREGRFALPRKDAEVLEGEAASYGRPEYAIDLFKPDGIERERERFRRGLAVIRAHPVWYAGVMLRRGRAMLRYNDFGAPDVEFETVAPTLSRRPGFGHQLEDADDRAAVWSASASDLLASASTRSAQAQLSPAGNALEISSDHSPYAGQFASSLVPVQRNTDYVLRLALRLEQGQLAMKVEAADPRVVLAVAPVSQARKTKPKDSDGDDDHTVATEAPLRVLEVPFASGDNTEVRLAFYNDATGGAVLTVGRAEMFEVGPTPQQWTSMPRALIGGVQKNLFKTDLMRLLIAAGVVCLALARRGRTLAILLIVPAYYLCVQSALHTEYRYILGMHYFLFILAAVALYSAGSLIRQAVRQALPKT